MKELRNIDARFDYLISNIQYSGYETATEFFDLEHEIRKQAHLCIHYHDKLDKFLWKGFPEVERLMENYTEDCNYPFLQYCKKEITYEEALGDYKRYLWRITYNQSCIIYTAQDAGAESVLIDNFKTLNNVTKSTPNYSIWEYMRVFLHAFHTIGFFEDNQNLEFREKRAEKMFNMYLRRINKTLDKLEAKTGKTINRSKIISKYSDMYIEWRERYILDDGFYDGEHTQYGFEEMMDVIISDSEYYKAQLEVA